MKKHTFKIFSALFALFAFVSVGSPAVAAFINVSPIHAGEAIAGMALVGGFMHSQGMLFSGPDLSAISNAFGTLGPIIFRNLVNKWMIGNEAQKYVNVKTPIFLPKLTAVGNPRPYREQDDFTTGAKFTDRTLTVSQSKWDFQINAENYRNTYLASVASGALDPSNVPFEQYIIEQVANEYLSQMLLSTVYLGVLNSSGSGAADIATGWGTTIAALITATTITPTTTGAITATNAVTAVETLTDSLPSWLKEMGFAVICSYDVFAKYRKAYRTANSFNFDPNTKGQYQLDGVLGTLTPRAYMGSSQRLIAVPAAGGTSNGVLIYGTDGDAISLNVTPHLDLLQLRMKMPIGFQIGDTAAIFVNEQS
jgi:hypothetical protein